MKEWIGTHRAVMLTAVVALLGIMAILAFGYFEVQTAFIDDTVEQSVPVAATETTHVGTFEGREHDTSGSAIVLGGGDVRFLRFESFETSNGPDVHVYLARDDTSGVASAVDLGPLRGNVGDQNYELPVGVDVDEYDTVLVWCVRFDALFGSATLTAA